MMKRLLFVLVAAAVLFPVSAGAQAISPTVEVTRKYDVSIGDIVKPFSPASFNDSLLTFERNFDYSIFSRPYHSLYDFTPYDALQLKPVDPQRYPLVYARIGCQYPVMPSAEVHLQKITHKGLYFSLSGHHDSFYGLLPSAVFDTEVQTGRMQNGIRGDFKYAWSAGEFNFKAGYDYDRYSFDNNGYRRWNNLSAFDFSAGLNSAHKEDGSIYYDFTARLKRTASAYSGGVTAIKQASEETLSLPSDTLRLAETKMQFKGTVGTTFDIHRVYINMDIRFAGYDDLKNYTLGVVEFSPMYEYNRGWFSGKLGVRFGNRFGIKADKNAEVKDGNDLEPWTNIFPDIDARLRLVKDYLWLHAVIGGGNDMNAYSDLLKTVPWLAPSAPLHFGTRPFDASLTLESVVLGRVAMNLSGGYVINRSKVMFSPRTQIPGLYSASDPDELAVLDSPHLILPFYEDVNTLYTSIEAFWKSEDLTMGGEFLHNWYFSPDGLNITELPKNTARLYARYDIKERFIFSLDYNFRSPVSGKKFGYYEVPAVHSLDANVNFVINRHFMIYLKAGNILNQRNQYVPLYVEPGRNFGGGISVTF